jgi:hypothetical protein
LVYVVGADVRVVDVVVGGVVAMTTEVYTRRA